MATLLTEPRSLEFLAPLTNYKHPLVPPTTSWSPLPQGSAVSRLSAFVGFPTPWECCQPVFSSSFVDYPVQLGMWKLTALDVSYLSLHILRDPIHFRSDPIMGNWDLCGPSNCHDLHLLTLLKVVIFLTGPTSIKSKRVNGQEEVL